MVALEIVDQVLQDSGTKHQSQTRAERLRAELESRLTPQQIALAQTQAHSKQLGQIVEEILARKSEQV